MSKINKELYPEKTEAIGKADTNSAEIKTPTQEQTDAIKKIREIWDNGTAVFPDKGFPHFIG